MIIVVTRCCLAMRSDRQGYLKRMRYAVLIKLSLGAFLLMAGCALFLECGKTGALQYNDASFDALQSVREAREAELTAYFEKLRGLTITAVSDTLFTSLFKTKPGDNRPVSLPSRLEDQIDKHFLKYYGEFYDIL